jgi:hypothetical protein
MMIQFLTLWSFFAEKTRSVFHEGGVPGVSFFFKAKKEYPKTRVLACNPNLISLAS